MNFVTTMNNSYFGPGQPQVPSRPPRQPMPSRSPLPPTSNATSINSSNVPPASLTAQQQQQRPQQQPAIPRQPSALNHRLVYPKLATCEIEIYSGVKPAATSNDDTATLISNVNSLLKRPLTGRTSNDVAASSGAYEESILNFVAKHKRDEERASAEREKRQIQKQHQLEERLRHAARARENAELEKQRAEHERITLEARKAANAEAERLKIEEEQIQKLKEEYDMKLKLLQQRKNNLSPSTNTAATTAMNGSPRSANKQKPSLPSTDPPKQAPPPIPTANLAPASASSSAATSSTSNRVINVEEERLAMSPRLSDSPRVHDGAIKSFSECTDVRDREKIREYLTLLNFDVERGLSIFFGDNPATIDSALEKAQALKR